MDIFAEATRSVALRTTLAPLLVFAAGTLSGVGPCAAPRLLALTSCAGASPRRSGTITIAFLVGLMSAYASFGIMSGLLGRLIDISHWTYGIVAATLLIGGMLTLLGAEPHPQGPCKGKAYDAHAVSVGGVFLLGASFAFVISPCCTPLVTTVVAYTADTGDPFYGASMLALFALGHGLPLIPISLATRSLTARLRRAMLHQAASIASGTLMIVLSAFYWCLL
jgi:cytochrome c-type biogenesis protein